jgi:signal transduction histidine kinase
MQLRFQSLQARVAVRLAGLYVVAMGLAVGLLVYQAYETAGTLNDHDLNSRAAELARNVSVDPSKGANLDLPPRLAAAYQSPSSTDIFAVRTADGRVIGSSPPSFGELAKGWPAPGDDASYFHLKDFGSEPQDYYGLSVMVASAAGPLSVSVARAAGADLLVHSMLREFVFDIAWVVPLLVLVTLAIAIFVIRNGLQPVREVSEKAAAIGPNTASLRLPDANLPSEVTPLVSAVNRAFDRLEQGFATQRKFTANAAHQLRTPLAIITAALDAMEGNGELTKLKADVTRMNRLVEQLLRVARLDAVALDVSGTVDLNAAAADVVATMAPWALGQQRTLSFSGPTSPVKIAGNIHAIEDALRNLIENAVIHSPQGTEIKVSVRPDGSVSVQDEGPGIPACERELIFERFWRGKGAPPLGAGLGLAIVKEIMNAHRGNVIVDAPSGGGTVFTLRFAAQAGQPLSS